MNWIKNDYCSSGGFLSECFVRSFDYRISGLSFGNMKKQLLLERKNGLVLSHYFFDKLENFEKSGKNIYDFIQDEIRLLSLQKYLNWEKQKHST
jgi:hypothetical protein